MGQIYGRILTFFTAKNGERQSWSLSRSRVNMERLHNTAQHKIYRKSTVPVFMLLQTT